MELPRSEQKKWHCALGVGCDKAGICYAAANGQPEQCGREQNVQVTKALEPCPLDGGKAEVVKHRYHGTGSSGMETPEPFIRCIKCGLSTKPVRCDDWPSGRKAGLPTYNEAEAIAIAAWNHRTRAEPDLVEAANAAEDLLKHFDERGFHLPSVMLGEHPRTQVRRVERLRAALTHLNK